MDAQLTGMAVFALIAGAGILVLALLKRRAKGFCAAASIIGALICCAALTSIYALHIEPNLLTVTQRTITNSSLPPSFEDRKVAFVTDIHIGKYYKEKDFARLIGKLDALEPDLVLIGGDIVDNSVRSDVDPAAIGKLLKGVHAPLGIYAVEGNHDIEDSSTRAFMQKVYEVAGVKLLLNQNAIIEFGGGRIALAGLKESFLHTPDAAAAYKGIPEGTFTIGLVHQPDYATQFTAYTTPLVLSGHSHGGIVVLPFYGPVLRVRDAEKMVKGVYQLQNTEVYVSNGIGEVILRARLGAPPEIVIYTLSRGD